VVSVVENTGNHDFKVKNNLTLKDSNGHIVASAKTTLSLWAIIPGMSREIKAELFPNVDLSPGLYHVTSQMTLNDGTILATGATDLELATGVSAVAAPPSTSGTSNSVVVPKAGTTNWVSVILVMAGAAILGFIIGLFLMSRRLKKPVTAVLPPVGGTGNTEGNHLPVTKQPLPLEEDKNQSSKT
jgi:hypothetical protein